MLQFFDVVWSVLMTQLNFGQGLLNIHLQTKYLMDFVSAAILGVHA